MSANKQMSIRLVWPAVLAALLCAAAGGRPQSVTKQVSMMPMRDGVRLATDIYFPALGAAPYDVILARTPYGRHKEDGYARFFTGYGYVVVVQDVRGRFDSEGDWDIFVNERQDGYDTVEWLAAQQWSSGNVGMIGASYLGWAALWAAVAKPPHLRTVIANMTGGEPSRHHVYQNGMFHLGNLDGIHILEGMRGGGKISNRPWHERVDHALPVSNLDFQAYGRKIPFWQNFLLHNTNDSYWERSNFSKDLETLQIPVLLQGGWFDATSGGLKHNYEHLRRSRSRFVKMILGPWGHSDEASTSSGSDESGEQVWIDLYELYRRWFDRWLRGAENGITDEPAVQLYAVNLDRWLAAEAYPLPATSYTSLYLSSDGDASVGGDGRLLLEKSDLGTEFDSYTYDPGDPTPSLWFGAPQPYQEVLQWRDDILVYETEPLADTLVVAGPITLELFASTSALDTDWFAYWRIIESDGDEYLMGGGGLRARFRDSWSRPQLLEESTVYRYTLDLRHMSIAIPAGSVIRLEIASAAYPRFSRNLNTGGHNELETEYAVAEQRVYHSEAYPSRLILPLVDPKQYE